MTPFLKVGDLPSTVRQAVSDGDLALLLTDVSARAVAAAPCLSGPLTDGQRAQVVAVLRAAVGRYAERVSRDDRQMTSGPFSIGPVPGSGEPRALLWPSEVEELQSVCRRRGRAVVGWLG